MPEKKLFVRLTANNVKFNETNFLRKDVTIWFARLPSFH